MKYKTLTSKDKIRKGDQWLDYLGKWVKCEPEEYGAPGDDCGVTHRRPIKSKPKAKPIDLKVEPTYRILKSHETIKKGDQWKSKTYGDWTTVTDYVDGLGNKVKKHQSHYEFRRLVNKSPYEAGYEAGYATCKAKIEAAMKE